MFKIKCGDKYFKKTYYDYDELDVLVENYIESGNSYGKFLYDYKIYRVGTGGSNCSIQLVSNILEASLFDDCDDRGLDSQTWYQKLNETFDIKFINVN